mmetsp:Transcript_968/g.2193  ORF Transcript_968/g.2193 Transcript_968/m.2193 type:complete len:238 (-) Transcript_968:258-971(-)
MFLRSLARRCDHYGALGLPREATQAQVRESYLRLAKQHHPDVCQRLDAQEHFRRVQSAWEVLKDPRSRADYDREATAASHRRGFAAASWPGEAWAGPRGQAARNAGEARAASWYEDLCAEKAADARRRAQASMRDRHVSFDKTHAEPVRERVRQFESVLREIRSDPEVNKFVGSGMQVKLMCQLGFILMTMLNLALWIWARGQQARSSQQAAAYERLAGRQTSELERMRSRGGFNFR